MPGKSYRQEEKRCCTLVFQKHEQAPPEGPWWVLFDLEGYSVGDCLEGHLPYRYCPRCGKKVWED